METITLKEMITVMDTGMPFSIGFRTCNKQKDTGGEWIAIDKARKYDAPTRGQQATLFHTSTTNQQRNPRHYENSTRNICAMASGEIIKVHLRLIRRFNNKQVL